MATRRSAEEELTMDVCGSVSMVCEELHILHVRRKGQVWQVLRSVHTKGV